MVKPPGPPDNCGTPRIPRRGPGRKVYSPDQIADALKAVAAGRSLASVCRELGASETTFHRWRRLAAEKGRSKATEALREPGAALATGDEPPGS